MSILISIWFALSMFVSSWNLNANDTNTWSTTKVVCIFWIVFFIWPFVLVISFIHGFCVGFKGNYNGKK